MPAKLEIEIDEVLHQKAEAWAERRGISLASAVSAYLHEVTREDLPEPRSDWLKDLIRIGRATASGSAVQDAGSDYVEYLEKKYS